MATIRPVGDRILVKQHKPETTYGNSGIYIPDSHKEKDDKGQVVAIGEDVMFNQFIQPVKVSHMDEDHILLRQQDIWAIQDV